MIFKNIFKKKKKNKEWDFIPGYIFTITTRDENCCRYTKGMKIKYIFHAQHKVIIGTIEHVEWDGFYDVTHIWLRIEKARDITLEDLLVEVKEVETDHD